ncbi:MAG: hypothetical protein AAGG01_19840, partial [Planctomycetota bacterium]
CAGVWRPLGGLSSAFGASADSCQEASAFAGATTRAATIAENPARFEKLLHELERADLAIRIDLEPASAGTLPRGLGRALGYDPDLVLAELTDIGALEALDERLEEAEVGLVAGVRAQADDPRIQAIPEWALGSRSCVAIRMDSFDEATALAINDVICDRSGDSPLALFAPTWEFATAHRHGVTALDGDIGLLTPAQAGALLRLAHDDLGEALELEKRLLRAVDGELARTLRRVAHELREETLRSVFEEFEARKDASSHGGVAEALSPDLLAALNSIGLPGP